MDTQPQAPPSDDGLYVLVEMGPPPSIPAKAFAVEGQDLPALERAGAVNGIEKLADARDNASSVKEKPKKEKAAGGGLFGKLFSKAESSSSPPSEKPESSSTNCQPADSTALVAAEVDAGSASEANG